MKRAFMSITLLVLSLSMVMMLLMGVAAAACRVNMENSENKGGKDNSLHRTVPLQQYFRNRPPKQHLFQDRKEKKTIIKKYD